MAQTGNCLSKIVSLLIFLFTLIQSCLKLTDNLMNYIISNRDCNGNKNNPNE